MTALPVLNETTWARMSWHARQQWLTRTARHARALAATIRDLEERRDRLEALMAHKPSDLTPHDMVTLAALILARLPHDPNGAERLRIAADEADSPTERARRARRATRVRNHNRQEAS